MKIRVRLAKGPAARFLSHLDLQRTLERSLRRAEIPFAMSLGFSPHPRISFAAALAVGITSEAEFVDVELTEEMAPEEFVRRLNAGFPAGLSVAEARRVPDTAPTLMALMDAADYRITVALPAPTPPAELAAGLSDLLARSEVLVAKETKSGLKTVNIRPQVYRLELAVATDGDVDLLALVQSGSAGNLRPEDLVAGLAAVAPGWGGARERQAHRLAVYHRQGQRLVEPWEL